MLTIKVCHDDGKGGILTKEDLYQIESHYHEDDVLISEITGEMFFIQEIHRDENGRITEIICE